MVLQMLITVASVNRLCVKSTAIEILVLYNVFFQEAIVTLMIAILENFSHL